MASQSFSLIGQEQEQELVACGTRQSRGPTPQSRPNSRMEEMLSQLLQSQDAIIKSQDATAKSLENRIVENARTLEAKLSGTDDKLSHIAYKQIKRRQSGLKSGGRGSGSKNFAFLNFDFIRQFHIQKIDFSEQICKQFRFFSGNFTSKKFIFQGKFPKNFDFFHVISQKNPIFKANC